MNQDAEGNSLNELAALRQRLEELEAEHRDLQQQVSRRRFFSRKFVPRALAGTLVVATVAILWGQKAISIFVDPNGNVGIGTNTPGFPLTFSSTTGDKISLFGQSGPNYGLGIQHNLLQIHSYGSDSDIAFGYGESSNFKEAMRVKGNGKVGIGTDPNATLDVAGTLNVSKESTFKGGVGINAAPAENQNLLIVATKDKDNIPFNVANPDNTVNWLSVLSGGKVVMNGGGLSLTVKSGIMPLNVTNPDNTVNWLSVFPSGKVVMNGGGLNVKGDALIDGKVSSKGRYQKDDEPETTYEIPPPYHLVLTGRNYGGNTKKIPQDVLESLCGTPGGCEVRMSMTRWQNDTQTESASEVFWFYYSKTDGHWRTNDNSGETDGVAGGGGTKHAKTGWNTCFFTDGSYSNGKDLGSKDKSMKLHVSTAGYTWPNRTCELNISK